MSQWPESNNGEAPFAITASDKHPEIPTLAKATLWLGIVATLGGAIVLAWVLIVYPISRRSHQLASLEQQRISLQRLEASEEHNAQSLADFKSQLAETRAQARRDYDLVKQKEQHVDYATHLMKRELPTKASNEEFLQLTERLQELELSVSP